MAFKDEFRALTGHDRFPWQETLYEELHSGRIRAQYDLPTGLGKTSIIPIWLLALAQQSQETGAISLPRRLVYVVNRRTVVDQATTIIEQIRERLIAVTPDQHLVPIREGLMRLASVSDLSCVLAVSTLRGELADNGKWRLDPARPTVIIGTVDMIGSKLLFRGYGDSRYFRPHHAGLLGQDSLIVLDEAHLTPAFGALLRSIANEQSKPIGNGHPPTRPICVAELSATISPGGTAKEEPFRLTEKDKADSRVQERIYAVKRLKFQPVEVTKDEGTRSVRSKTAEKVVKLALGHAETKRRILIYVQSPEDVKVVRDAILKDAKPNIPEKRVAILTGTLRGFERDELVKSNPVYRWFLGGAAMDGTAYLISTSAGEVGVDLDADHLVCDLTTLDSMIQRLGRVNRRGKCDAKVDVVVESLVASEKAEPPKDADNDLFGRRSATWKALSDLHPLPDDQEGRLNASPEALRAVGGCTAAWAATPRIPPLTDILLDSWSLTSLRQRLPTQPPVEDWLHGVEKETPEACVVWRKELLELARAQVPADQVAEAIEVFPLRAAERLRDASWRIQQELAKLARRLANTESFPAKPVLLVHDSGAEWVSLAELGATERESRLRALSRLSYATMILPIEAGGLNKDGLLDGSSGSPVADVAEASIEGQRVRQRVWVDGESKELPLDGSQVVAGLVTRCRLRVCDDDLLEDDGLVRFLEYRVASADALGTGESRGAVFLAGHTNSVVNSVKLVAERVLTGSGSQALREALILAAQWHDCGKDRAIWQHAAHNYTPGIVLAKSGRRGLDGRALQGYRHEMGSLLEAAADPVVQQHPEKDLILHLIAAHHGWARPHFDPEAADAEKHKSQENQDAMVETMRRYARLQQRFGRWGLAWLESLLRCADGLASAGKREG